MNGNGVHKSLKAFSVHLIALFIEHEEHHQNGPFHDPQLLLLLVFLLLVVGVHVCLSMYTRYRINLKNFLFFLWCFGVFWVVFKGMLS